MRPRFVLFGDSITELSFSPGGWGSALTDRYARKADIVLRGYSGYNTRWALFLLNKIFPPVSSTTIIDSTTAFPKANTCKVLQVSEDAPALVTIFFGANDAALPHGSHQRQYVPLSEYKDNLLKIVSHVKSLSKDTLVVLITPPPICEETLQVASWKYFGAKPEDDSPRTNETTGLYAKACIEVAKKADLPVIDLWSCMQKKSGWQTSYLSDGLHLSPEGNTIVFEKLIEVLADEGLSFEAMPWDFPQHGDVHSEEPAKTSW